MPRTFRLRPERARVTFKPPTDADDSPEYKRAVGIRNSARWQSIRAHMRRHNPVCEDCGQRATEEVHHIEPLTECPERGFDKTNLLCVCECCHYGIHRKDTVDVRARCHNIALTREL